MAARKESVHFIACSNASPVLQMEKHILHEMANNGSLIAATKGACSMAAKKDFSKDAADIFGLRKRREMEARQCEATQAPATSLDAPPAAVPEEAMATRRTFRQ